MSNLSELLPAGSSVKSADFVAQGTLASGVTVGLRSDGKVEAITGTVTGVGSTATITTNTARDTNGAYDTGQDKVVVVYGDASNNTYMTVAVGTPSGSNGLTFGTPVVVNSSYAYWLTATFDPNAGKTLVGGQDGGNSYNGAFFAVTVSGTTPSVGAKASFFGAIQYTASSYDTNAQKILVTCNENTNSNYGAAAVATISGTSVSFGSKLTFNSSDTRYPENSYNTNAQKTLVGYIHQANQYYRCRILTITGTSVATSDFFNIYAGAVKMAPVGLSYDPTNYNHIGVFANNSSNAFIGKAGPMSVNNTQIYFGADVAISPASGFEYQQGKVSILYYPDTAKHIVTYGNSADTKIYYRALTAGSSTLTVGAETELVTTGSSNNGATESDLIYNPDQGNLIYTYRDGGADDGEAVAFTLGTTNASSFIGITDQAISSAATGKVVCKGGAITNTGLIPFAPTAGSPVTYESGFAVTKSVSYDTNANKAVIANRRGSDDHGIVYVGTVSGTSISFGSVVVFNAGTTEYISSAFDSNANKVVIAYTDSGNSGHGTAIVGTVSGTSITFGTEVVFEAAAVVGKSIVFDSTSNKVVIFYEDDANNDYGTAVVGTVSGTSISFGTPVVFASVNMQITVGEGAAYDSANNRAVVFYRTVNAEGYAAVGTVSGTSISFGTPVKFSSGAAELDYISAAFDSAANKIVTSYTVNTDSGYSKAIVGTVSGTSISFGSEATFESANSGYTSATFNSTINKVVISYTDFANSNYGTLVISTISGTSISFTTPAVFTSTTAARYISTAFDPDTGSVISGFSDQNNSYYAKSVVTSFSNALTPNTAYFVQDDGTISTTSSTTKAGTALSTTSLLLTG